MLATRQVPLLDLKAQHRTIRHETMAAIERVVDSQQFIMGDEVKSLEQEIAAYTNTSYAIGCASGSDALFLALLAAGVGHGDAVLTTPYSFFATVGSIVRAGASPVFVDILPDTFNMDVSQVEAALDKHPNVKAIIPIHLFGACAEMDDLMEIAARRNVFVIEDAAQSLGAEYKGRRAGSIGDVGCFSFFPSKNLGGYGDAGALTTNDPALAEKLAALRVHGAKETYIHQWVGINSRIDALQAAVLRVKLPHLDSWTSGRQRNAALYRKHLKHVTIPQVAASSTRHIYNQFVILSESRDELQAYLKLHGVGTAIYYPLPLHLQECFANFGGKPGDYPVSERIALQSLALPVYPELAPDDIEYVCEVIELFHHNPAR